jgi:hypothetical protein
MNRLVDAWNRIAWSLTHGLAGTWGYIDRATAAILDLSR